ncbi:Protein MICAL-2 [Pteropus alecto]|uniref:Protein MICAL-2 n=1 Tax=Pteropus alecto TaxID=9402 RepID=L5L2T2_PTEAL|nr:Protein MICAL-2 [Pteropus alecto]
MGENEDEKQTQAGQVFENFVQASTCKGTLQAFNILTRHLDLDPLDHRNFYSKLKSKVTTWKAKALWYKLDKRGSHKEYKRGKSCMNTKLGVAGPWKCLGPTHYEVPELHSGRQREFPSHMPYTHHTPLGPFSFLPLASVPTLPVSKLLSTLSSEALNPCGSSSFHLSPSPSNPPQGHTLEFVPAQNFST